MQKKVYLCRKIEMSEMRDMLFSTRSIRELWYDYRSEFVFGAVLLLMMGVSFCVGTLFSEQLMDVFINPLEYTCTLAVCFFGAFLLFRHQEDNTIRRSWAIVLLVWGCIQFVLLYLRYFLGIKAVGGTPDDPFFNASVTVGNILAFLLYIYPTQVLRPGWLNWWKAVLLLLPMIVLGVVDYFVEADLLKLMMLYPALIFFMLCRHVRKYRQWCEDNFSTMDDIDVQWIVRYLTMLFIVGASFYFIVFWFVPNRIFTQQWILLFILSYTTERVLFRPDPWSKIRQDALHEEKELDDVEPESTEVDQAHVEVIDKWIRRKKPFLHPEFQLMDLRQVLPMNRTYLSQLINNAYGCSFYQWVNRLRVEEAKRLMTTKPDLKMQDIANKCGFSSRQALHRAFLRETGITPREFLAQPNNQ